jgi:hypothetical protein
MSLKTGAHDKGEMSAAAKCAPFWLEQPRILADQAAEFFPFTESDRRCTAAALNSFTRFGIYAGIVLAAVRMDLWWLLVGVVFAVFAAGAWLWMGQHGTTREGTVEPFDGGYEERYIEKPSRMDIVDNAQLDSAYVPDVIGADGGRRTEPTAANPFMNLLVSEYSMDPTRPPAAAVQSVAVRSEIDQFFETMFAADPGDVFGKTQSQRMWVAQPVSTVPNDQESYQNWLYRVPGRTCKEGNGTACNFVTDNKIPWREIGPST